MSERIFPSSDLHLFPGAPATPLAVFASLDGSWTGFATLPGYALTLIPTVPAPSTTPIVELHGTTLVAVHEGEQHAVLRVSITPPNTQSWDLALRVTVHHELRQLYAATNTLTLETGRTDRVLTVYGRFADAHGNLSTHDVTRHVYLSYDVVSLTGDANAVQVDATGRVTTGSLPGTARVTISSGAATTSVEITVVAFQDDRPILVQRWRGSAFRKRSIVLISEGFTAPDQSRFEQLAGELAIGFVVDTPRSIFCASPSISTRCSFPRPRAGSRSDHRSFRSGARRSRSSSRRSRTFPPPPETTHSRSSCEHSAIPHRISSTLRMHPSS